MATIPTLRIYKGDESLIINAADYDCEGRGPNTVEAPKTTWKKAGWKTSPPSGAKSAPADEGAQTRTRQGTSKTGDEPDTTKAGDKPEK